jgi:chromosome segregation ATPase
VWPYVVAVLALAVGGAVGWLVSRANDDNEATVVNEPGTTLAVDDDQVAEEMNHRLDELLQQTQSNGSYVSDGTFPQIEEIIAIERAAAVEDLQGQVDLLSAAQDQNTTTITDLTNQVTELQSSLTAAEAERDQLKSQINTGSTPDQEFLAKLQEKEDEITALEDQLATAQTQLAESQAAASQATADLATAQSQLQAANAQLDALEATQIEKYVDRDITELRADAEEHGWLVVEKQIDDPQDVPGKIRAQTPQSGATVIRGSVIYVEYVKKP